MTSFLVEDLFLKNVLLTKGLIYTIIKKVSITHKYTEAKKDK